MSTARRARGELPAPLEAWLDADAMRRVIGRRLRGVWKIEIISGIIVARGEGPTLASAFEQALEDFASRDRSTVATAHAGGKVRRLD